MHFGDDKIHRPVFVEILLKVIGIGTWIGGRSWKTRKRLNTEEQFWRVLIDAATPSQDVETNGTQMNLGLWPSTR